MRAPGQPKESVAAEPIRQTWPMGSTETIARLIRAASVVEREPGNLIMEAERPSRVALVLSGTVVATWTAPDGRIVYAGLYGPGQFMGLATLSGAPNVVGIDALTPVAILTWPSDDFRAIAESDPALALDLLDRSIYAIQALNRLNKLRTFTSAASRLAGLLVAYEAFCFSKDAPLVARRHLAAMAGVSPEMVSRILREWEAAGLVRRIRTSGLELLDRRSLAAQAAPLADFPLPDPTTPGAWSMPSGL
jgi:CRP-like cAMP-binding protein